METGPRGPVPKPRSARVRKESLASSLIAQPTRKVGGYDPSYGLRNKMVADRTAAIDSQDTAGHELCPIRGEK